MCVRVSEKQIMRECERKKRWIESEETEKDREI